MTSRSLVFAVTCILTIPFVFAGCSSEKEKAKTATFELSFIPKVYPLPKGSPLGVVDPGMHVKNDTGENLHDITVEYCETYENRSVIQSTRTWASWDNGEMKKILGPEDKCFENWPARGPTKAQYITMKGKCRGGGNYRYNLAHSFQGCIQRYSWVFGEGLTMSIELVSIQDVKDRFQEALGIGRKTRISQIKDEFNDALRKEHPWTTTMKFEERLGIQVEFLDVEGKHLVRVAFRYRITDKSESGPLDRAAMRLREAVGKVFLPGTVFLCQMDFHTKQDMDPTVYECLAWGICRPELSK